MFSRYTSVVVLLSCVACSESSAPPAACPADTQLLSRFTEQEARFNALAANPDDEAVRKALGIERVIRRSERPARIWFPVWFHDFPGPGGCFKGYAYCEEPPAALVDNIDQKTKPGEPGSVEVYRLIKGNWYLFYQSND